MFLNEFERFGHCLSWNVFSEKVADVVLGYNAFKRYLLSIDTLLQEKEP